MCPSVKDDSSDGSDMDGFVYSDKVCVLCFIT